MMLDTWTPAVFAEMYSVSPICRLLRPSASSRSTSVSRAVKAVRAKEHGIQPVLGTITPFLGADRGIREAVNDALRSQRDWPVADFAAAVADPADGSRLRPGLDSGDGLHPGDAGARRLADAVDLAMFG